MSSSVGVNVCGVARLRVAVLITAAEFHEAGMPVIHKIQHFPHPLCGKYLS